MIGPTNSPIRTLLVDDEALARATLRVLVGADHDLVCIGECQDGREALRRIRSEDPDLVFLDVQMPGLDGLQVLDALGNERRAEIVFVTAFDAYALRAFAVNARDYLLKPFDDERFAAALLRAKEAVRRRRLEEAAWRFGEVLGLGRAPVQPSEPARHSYLERIVVRSAGSIEIVEVAELDYVQAEDYYVLLHVGAKSLLHRERLRDLEAGLPQNFMRIHRSTIVNTQRIRGVRTQPNGEHVVVLHTGRELMVSRSRRQQLDTFLGKR